MSKRSQNLIIKAFGQDLEGMEEGSNRVDEIQGFSIKKQYIKLGKKAEYGLMLMNANKLANMATKESGEFVCASKFMIPAWMPKTKNEWLKHEAEFTVVLRRRGSFWGR